MFRPSPYLTPSGRDPASIGIIHEMPEQGIQGGAALEHYHLTALQHATVLADQLYLITLEVVLAVGEHVLDTNGDVVLCKKLYTRSAI